MATVTFSGGNGAGGFNMLQWSAYDILYIIATTFSTNASSSSVTYDPGNGERLLATGSLGGYNADGDPTTGTINAFAYTTTRFSSTAGGPMTIAVSGLSVSVSSLLGWVQAGNTLALHGAVFNGADTITGSTGDDILEGYGGGDTINGGNGNDIIFGENNPGDEVWTSAAGNDTLNGGSGDDDLYGQGGNDTVNGDAGNDFLFGGIGNDILNGGTDIDFAVYTDATAAVTVSLAVSGQQNTGGAGLDTLSNLEGLVGSSFNDTLTGDSLSNYLAGGAGNDILNGGGGDDILEDDTGSNTADGGDGNDQITVGAGDDNVNGGSGDDTIDGGAGSNTLNGGDGNDLIKSGLAADVIIGGNGVDTVSYANATSGVIVSLSATGQQATGGAGLDTLSGIENAIGSVYGDTFVGNASDNVIDGGVGIDTVSYAAATQGVVVSLALNGAQNTVGAGTDTLTLFENLVGSAFNDTLTGNSGDNVIVGGGGTDVLDGGAGVDLLRLTITSSASIVLNTSTFLGSSPTVLADGTSIQNFERFEITTGAGNDVLTINSPSLSGANSFNGGAGTDRIVVDFSGNSSAVSINSSHVLTFASGSLTTSAEEYYLTGSAFADLITGGDGGDKLSGNGGADGLVGGTGSDILSGGTGDDFLFSGPSSMPLEGGIGLVLPFNMDSGTEVDTLIGGEGADYLFAGYGDNVDGGADGLFGDKLYISFQGASQGVNADFRQSTLTIGGGVITGIENVAYVEGSNFDDTIILNNGNGDGGFPVIYGFGGNDTLVSDYYTGKMYGGDGNDVVDGRNSQYLNLIDGGEGDDILYTDRNNNSATASGGSGNDTIYSGSTTNGGDGNDLIVLQFSYYRGQVHGDAGDDEIRASTAGNSLYGDDGNDLLLSNSGADQMDGGTGTDTASFATATGAVTVSLFTGTASGQGVGSDTLISIENITGGAYADSLTGDAQANVLKGGGGNDILYLYAGNDIGYGEDGNDTIFGDLGADTFYGGAGADRLEGGIDADSLNGGDDNDTLNGRKGGDQAYGEAGNDIIQLFSKEIGAGELVDGGSGIDQLSLRATTDLFQDPFDLAGVSISNFEGITVDFGEKFVVTIQFTGAQISGGFAANTVLTTQNANAQLIVNVLVGGSSLDISGWTVSGWNAANKFVFYADGTALALTGSGQVDEVNFGFATTSIVADLNNVVAGTGLAAGDTFANVDNFVGGNFGDTLYGNALANTFRGGDGGDTLILADGNDTAYGDAGDDLIIMGFGNDFAYGGDGTDVLFGEFGNDTMYGDQGTDILEGQDGTDTLFGGTGEDTLNGGNDNDVLYGEDGFDTLVGADQNDTLYGGNDGDRVIGGFGNDTLFGDEGDDFLFGEFDDDVLNGNNGNDVLYGQLGADTLNGNVGSDILYGDEGADILNGNDNEDTLFGGTDNDALFGGNGGDFLIGDLGFDTLTGGAGADIFFFQASGLETDVIADFSTAQGDRVVLQASGFGLGTTLNLGTNFFTGANAAPNAAVATLYYDQSSTALWYDADGTGAGSAYVLAFINGAPTLTASDFLLV